MSRPVTATFRARYQPLIAATMSAPVTAGRQRARRACQRDGARATSSPTATARLAARIRAVSFDSMARPSTTARPAMGATRPRRVAAIVDGMSSSTAAASSIPRTSLVIMPSR